MIVWLIKIYSINLKIYEIDYFNKIIVTIKYMSLINFIIWKSNISI